MTDVRSRLLLFVLVLAGLTGSGCDHDAGKAPTDRARPIPSRQGDWEPGLDGLWMKAPAPAVVEGEELERIEALGYADGYQAAGSRSGVVIHDSKRALDGLNLYCSGHEPAAYLMDMRGAILHRWSLTYSEVPDPLPDPHRWFSGSWRRVRLLEDGSLLAIFENLGLVKLDRDSNLEWWFDGNAHHDLDVAPDGSIAVLTRERRPRPDLGLRQPVIEDFVVFLTPGGLELERISILDALHRSSEHRRLLDRIDRPGGDLFHTNTVQILDDRLAEHGDAFRPGNLLLSIRHLDTIAVLDPESETIVWAATGDWRWQHEPTALATGNILLFDNLGLPNASRVVELDPRSLATTLVYQGAPPESFFSRYCGAASRLPNGNTLITETCAGRAFEISPDGDTVWEFSSPHRAGEHDHLVAALFEVVRIPGRPDWLDEGTQ